jgi:hypothetical protein
VFTHSFQIDLQGSDVVPLKNYLVSTKYLSTSPTGYFGSATRAAASHAVSLSNLLASTTYHFRVRSSDANGNPLVSDDQNFITQGQRPLPSSIIMTPGKEFAADSYVHTPLPDNAPLLASSSAYVASIVSQVTRPNSYGWSVNTEGGTSPVYIAPVNQPTVKVRVIPDPPPPPQTEWSFYDLWYIKAFQTFMNEVPMPEDFVPLRGGNAADGGDAEAIIYQPSTGRYWEGIRFFKTGKKVVNSAGRNVDEIGVRYVGYIGPEADPGAGGSMTTSKGYWQNGRPDGLLLGAQATSLPHLAGLITIAEQRAGVINHALFFMLGEAAPGQFVWPAYRTDGRHGIIPQGTCFRLPANLNLDAMDMDPYALMIAKAVQKYGMYLSDTAPNGAYFRAESAYPLSRWGGKDPYFGAHGILNPTSVDYNQQNTPPETWPNLGGHLRGFPYNKLQAVKVNHLTHRPGYGEL